MGRHDGPEKQLVPGSVVGFRFKHPSLHGGQPRPSPINSQGPVSASLIGQQTARAIGHALAGTHRIQNRPVRFAFGEFGRDGQVFRLPVR